MILFCGGAVVACSQASTDDGATESAYTNTSGESQAVRIPASYSMRSALGTGLNTVFMKASDTPCVKYADATPPVANKVSLGDVKFQAQVITTSSSQEIATMLGIQAGMSVSYSGLAGGASGGVDFGFTQQSKTTQEAVYVLVKAWGEGNDLSHANQEPRLTDEALKQWEVGPYEFVQKCGNNFISRRNAGAGLYMIYRFTAKEGTTKEALKTAVNGKFNARVVSGEAKVEVNTDFSEVSKISDMEFNMATFGLLTTSPNLDNLKAQKSEELEKVINSIFTAMKDASAKGPDSQEFNSLATISLQSSPYHTRLAADQFTAIRAKHAAQGSAAKELDSLIPDMTRVQNGIDEMWARMTSLSDAIADAEYIRDHQTQFTNRLDAGPDAFGMTANWIPKLEADWKGVKVQVDDCRDGGTRSQKFAGCWLEASGTAYAKAVADVAEFNKTRPRRVTAAPPAAPPVVVIQLAGQMIHSRHDANQCLTHQGEGGNVFVGGCDPNNANQRWFIDQQSILGGERTIIFKPQANKGLCLDMHTSEQVDGSGYRAYLHPCHGGDNQKFIHRNGELLQKFTRNNYCLDWWFGNGGTVHIPKCHSSAGLGTSSPGDNQQWDIAE